MNEEPFKLSPVNRGSLPDLKPGLSLLDDAGVNHGLKHIINTRYEV